MFVLLHAIFQPFLKEFFQKYCEIFSRSFSSCTKVLFEIIKKKFQEFLQGLHREFYQKIFFKKSNSRRFLSHKFGDAIRNSSMDLLQKFRYFFFFIYYFIYSAIFSANYMEGPVKNSEEILLEVPLGIPLDLFRISLYFFSKDSLKKSCRNYSRIYSLAFFKIDTDRVFSSLQRRPGTISKIPPKVHLMLLSSVVLH